MSAGEQADAAAAAAMAALPNAPADDAAEPRPGLPSATAAAASVAAGAGTASEGVAVAAGRGSAAGTADARPVASSAQEAASLPDADGPPASGGSSRSSGDADAAAEGAPLARPRLPSSPGSGGGGGGGGGGGMGGGMARSSSSTMLPDLTLPQRMAVDRLDVIKFLKSHSCYDFMPESGKVVVLDVRISVKLAFFALVEHELTYAPLWDEVWHTHVGMLTSTDLIQILEYGYTHNCVTQMFSMKVGQWLELNAALRQSQGDAGRGRAGTDLGAGAAGAGTADDQVAEAATAAADAAAVGAADGSGGAATVAAAAAPDGRRGARAPATTVHECIKIDAERSLYDAVKLLHRNRRQRVSIIDQDDSSTLLQVLTNHRLLLYVVKHFTRHVSRDHPVLGMSVKAAGVGCHDATRIVTLRNTAPLVEVLRALVRENISSVPVVDAEGRVVDVYSRQDAMYLTRIKKLSTAHLNATVVEVLKAQCLMLEREGLHTCSPDDTVGEVVQRMAADTAHRLVMVNADGCCVGLVSVSDIFRFFLNEE